MDPITFVLNISCNSCQDRENTQTHFKMISREEKLQLKSLITETVLHLCKSGLVPKLRGEVSIEGMIGVTVSDEEDLMLVMNLYKKTFSEISSCQ